LKPVEVLLQSSKGEVAEGTPFSAIEGYEKWAFGKEVGTGDGLAEGVCEVE
jgi:hypothetical protein